ncbi:hypothetical protein [Clostridium lacusfryxellense]|nr:hypothetical protein [Clostridium lacusfryxellense]MBU3114807.1 hypothetical protein [Clostridium lacusfryxellense]
MDKDAKVVKSAKNQALKKVIQEAHDKETIDITIINNQGNDETELR